MSKKTNYLLFKAKQIKRKITVEAHKHYSVTRIESYISKKYKRFIGYDMDWSNPHSYTQKIQYSKVHNHDKMRSLCSDKVAVREYVKKTIGEEYLIPIYGVWERFEDIDFDKLPNSFVLKTNHGSSTNIIVKDKSKLDMKDARKKFKRWLKENFAYYGFELHYAPIKPLIYAEQLLDFGDQGIEDYKFLCFDGNARYFWIDFNRSSNHKRNMYDMDWNLQAWNQWHYGNYDDTVEQPNNFNEMKEVAKKLAKGFDHVRVDLYNVNGHIYFGELTFTNGGGYEHIVPQEYDFILGNCWTLPKKDN